MKFKQKLTAFLLGYAALCVFLPLKMISGEQFVAGLSIILGAFTAGNVASKFSRRGEQ